jgi:hypothetical protein
MPAVFTTNKKWSVIGVAVLFLCSALAITVLSRGQSKKTETSPSLGNQPGIAWSQQRIEMFVSVGGSALRDVTFASGADLQSITVEPVPEIASLLSVQPSSFPSVSANHQQTVHIAVSIPTATTLGTYEGTIHVRSGNRTLPQTLKVTLHVLSYANANVGVGFDLPNFGRPTNVAVSESISGTLRIDVELKDSSGQVFIPTLRLIVFSKPNSVSLQEWFRQNIDVNSVLTTNATYQQQRLGNGLTALVRVSSVPSEYTEVSGPVEEAFLMSPVGDRVVSIIQSQDNDLESLGYSQTAIRSALLQILGTVQFF